jgi:predicted  nucleic acid-binding Zn-ribbon protein
MTKTVSPALTQSIGQLRNAVANLERVVARRAEDDRSLSTLKDELAIMQDDRARLAMELDSALAKTTRMDAIMTELLRRIDRSTTLVREVLGELAKKE